MSDEEREGGDHEHGHDAGAQSGCSGRSCAFWIELAGAAVIVVRVADSLKNVFLRLIRQGGHGLGVAIARVDCHASAFFEAVVAHFFDVVAELGLVAHFRCNAVVAVNTCFGPDEGGVYLIGGARCLCERCRAVCTCNVPAMSFRPLRC